MKKFLLLVTFIFSSFIYAQFSSPESVEWDSTNNRWLISNTGNHTISARTPSGVVTTFVPAIPISAGPHGIEILGNVVYACCGGSIRGFDLSTGSQVFSLNLGGSFLNGLTTDGDSVLYVTDFSAKKIYRVNPTTNQFYTLSSNTISTPNGIIYDGANNRCIFINWGAAAPIKAIGLTPPYTITTITATTLSNCDGITRDHLGYYYVTAWGNNRMNRFAADFTGGFTPMNSFVLNNPADIDCKFASIDTVGIPNAGNNTCTFIPLAPPTPSFIINDTAVCLGDQITFTNTSTNADSFSWIFHGGNPGTGTTSPAMITYDTLGTYSTQLDVTNVYGTTSLTHFISVSAAPTPVITAVGNDLSTTAIFSAYQWYHDGVLIPGATSQNYTATSGGAYYCEVTENGCIVASNIITSILAIENNFSVQAKVFPNPAAEFLTVEMILPGPQSVYYSIIDIQGRVLLSSTEMFEFKGPNYIIVDLNKISNGTYVLKLNAENLMVTQPFVVSK